MENNISIGGTIKNITLVTLSNLFTIFAGVMVGFILPKIMDVIDYGYYKTFTLYVGYVGLASLGIIDGIVLVFGGKNYKELNKEKFRSYFAWYLLIHLIITVIFLIICISTISGEYKYIFIFFSLDIICSNFTGYYQYISQITMRFKELSIRNFLKSVFTLFSVIIFYIIYRIDPNNANYRAYILIVICFNYLLTFWYMYTYREISFGKMTPLKETAVEIKKYIKVGFPLFFSCLCASLILTLDRQFVNILWPVSKSNDYSIYAFAYNMLSLVTVATSAISTVIYPILKRTDNTTLKKNYNLLIAIDLCFVFACLIAYFPLQGFIEWFLPKYNDSMQIFRIIFPGLAISSVITVVIHNYYKTLGLSFYYFIFSIIALVISFISNVCAYCIFKSTLSISIASILTMMIWYLIVQWFMIKRYSVPWIKNTISILVGCIAFYLVTIIKEWYLGFILYLCFLTIFILIFYIKDIKYIIRKGEKRK